MGFNSGFKGLTPLGIIKYMNGERKREINGRKRDYIGRGSERYYIYYKKVIKWMALKDMKITNKMHHILLLLPLALQPAVGIGLSNNTSPFSPIYHQLSIFSLPSLEDLFPLLTILSWVFLFFSSLPVIKWRSFWASYPPPFSPGDPANLSFAPLSILLYFLLYSTLLFLDEQGFPRW